MYNVLDVCHYVIKYSNDKGYGISNLKLQKILYFIQAYFLTCTEEGMPCFSENIEAWEFGPVVPEAYHEYKQYGSGHIPTVNSRIVYSNRDIWSVERVPYEDVISRVHKKHINTVVDTFSGYSATALVTLTHKQDPWKNAYKPNENNIISIDEIRSYFNG